MLVRALLLEETSMLLQLPDTWMSWGRRLSGLVVGQVDRTICINVQLADEKAVKFIGRSKYVSEDSN